MPYTPHYKRQSQEPAKPKRDGYDWTTLWVAIIGVTVVAISTGVTAWMAILMRSQLDAMRDQQRIVESQQRPWITVDVEPDGPFRLWPDGSANLPLRVKTKNVGQAAASGINIATEVIEVEGKLGGGIEIPLAQIRLCEETRTQTFRMPEIFGSTLFPGEETVSRDFVEIPADDLTTNTFDLNNAKYIQPVIIGCVDYQLYISPTHHQTRFAIRVMMLDPVIKKLMGTPSGRELLALRNGQETPEVDWTSIPVGDDVAVEDLRLRKSPWGNGFAD